MIAPRRTTEHSAIVIVFIYSLSFSIREISGGFCEPSFTPLKIIRKAKYPTCGTLTVATSSHGKEKTGETTGRIPSQTARRPHF